MSEFTVTQVKKYDACYCLKMLSFAEDKTCLQHQSGKDMQSEMDGQNPDIMLLYIQNFYFSKCSSYVLCIFPPFFCITDNVNCYEIHA